MDGNGLAGHGGDRGQDHQARQGRRAVMGGGRLPGLVTPCGSGLSRSAGLGLGRAAALRGESGSLYREFRGLPGAPRRWAGRITAWRAAARPGGGLSVR